VFPQFPSKAEFLAELMEAQKYFECLILNFSSKEEASSNKKQ
jgi:hypothetical protein